MQPGPVGCPPVAEFAAQGLVGPFDASTQSVRSWIADALTIRHRLPRLWERVVAGDVHHWKARQIATLTAPPRGGGGRRSRPADGRLGGAAAVADVPENPGRHHAAGRRIHLPGTGTTRRSETGSPGHPVGSRTAHPDRPRRSRRRDHDAGALPPRRRVPGRRRRRRPAAGADVESDRDHREPGPAHRSPRPARRRPRPPPGAVGEGRRPPGRSDRPVGRRPPGRRVGKPPSTATTTNPDQTTTRGGTRRGPTTSRTSTGWSTDARSPSPTATTSPGTRATSDQPTRPAPTASPPAPTPTPCSSRGRRRSGRLAGDRSPRPSWLRAPRRW